MRRAMLLLGVLLALIVGQWVVKDRATRVARIAKSERAQSVATPTSAPLPPAKSAAAPRPIAFGLTFALVPPDANAPPEVVGLNCHGEPRQLDRPHQDSCNPYHGDTSCRTVLPVLCIKVTKAAKPVAVSDGFYQGWVNGILAATSPVMGAVLESAAVASARCVAELGPGWKMAEFHDGQGGWGLQGQKGSDFSPNNRYWVHINDQPGNCWDSEP